MDPFSQSLKLPTIHTSFTIKTQLPGLVAFGKNRDQTLLAFFIHIINIVAKKRDPGILDPELFLAQIRKVEARLGKLAKIRKVETD